MNTFSKTAMITLATASLGFSFAIPANAQPAAPAPVADQSAKVAGPNGMRPMPPMNQIDPNHGGNHGNNHRGWRNDQRFNHTSPQNQARPAHYGQQFYNQSRNNLLNHLVTARNAEQAEVAAVRLTHRLELNDTQTELLAALRADINSARSTMMDVFKEFHPTPGTMPKRGSELTQEELIGRYAASVAMTTARADSTKAIQPALESFIKSLETAQIAKLAPQHQMRTRPSLPMRPMAPVQEVPAEAVPLT